MNKTLVIDSLKQIKQFKNDKGIIEIVVRGQKNRIKAFQKVALSDIVQKGNKEISEKAIGVFNKNFSNMLNDQMNISQITMHNIQQLASVSKLGIVMNGLNLAATSAGFAIMYEKLDNISSEIKLQFDELKKVVKQEHDVRAIYEFEKVLGEYTDMLDCRRRQQPYSEEQMRFLVQKLYTVLNLLKDIFRKGIASNNHLLIVSIFSLLSMFTVALKYFDEQYYFNNHNILIDTDVWHSSHDKWMSIYHELTEEWFIEKLQDYAVFETDLDTIGVDIYYTELIDRVNEAFQEVVDNQDLIKCVGDIHVLEAIRENSTKEMKELIDETIRDTFEDQDSKEISDIYKNVIKQAELLLV